MHTQSKKNGVDILKVQEIRGYESVTRIVNSPEYIKGVVNLRGTIVPNIGSRIVGMVVNSVSDVTTLSRDQIRPAPVVGTVMDTNFIAGLGTIEDRMLILIDIERLMSSADMGVA